MSFPAPIFHWTDWLAVLVVPFQAMFYAVGGMHKDSLEPWAVYRRHTAITALTIVPMWVVGQAVTRGLRESAAFYNTRAWWGLGASLIATILLWILVLSVPQARRWFGALKHHKASTIEPHVARP